MNLFFTLCGFIFEVRGKFTSLFGCGLFLISGRRTLAGQRKFYRVFTDWDIDFFPNMWKNN